LLFSVFLLWRGHHEPGGGFVGGLVAAIAGVLIALSEGVESARRFLRFAPHRLVAVGLAISAGAGLIAPLSGRPFLTGLWLQAAGSDAIALGTPLLFDLGVYLTVMGVVLSMLLTLIEDTR
jgi:multisubunit Na+/H+ antiporter MnhB subunit